jgi:hypothetical protein
MLLVCGCVGYCLYVFVPMACCCASVCCYSYEGLRGTAAVCVGLTLMEEHTVEIFENETSTCTVFRDVTPCSPVEVNLHSEET